MAKPLVSFIVPVFNEAVILRDSVKMLIHHLEALSLPFEIIVANDGSSDRTLEEAQQISLKYNKVRVVSLNENMGRGEAILFAAKHVKGKVVAFMDADMAVDLDHLPELLYPILDGTYDISTGSRWVPGADVSRKLIRRIISFCYNKLVRLMFKSSIYDHQCGFKAFSRPAFMVLSREMGSRKDRSWAWDTEVLIRAQLHKFKIKEFAVKWREGKGSKFRIFRDSMKIFAYVLRLKFELFRERTRTPMVLDHFDSIASSYDSCDITSNRRFTIISEAIAKVLHRQQERITLLDLGGGTGCLWGSIEKLSDHETISYLLLDPSREMLRHAKTKIFGLQAFLAIGEALPFRPGTIGCVICSEVLEHTQNPELILAQARGILKSGGILIVSNPNMLWAPVEFLAEKIHLKPPEGPHRYLPPWNLRRELRANHFIILKEESFVHPRGPSNLDNLFSNDLVKNFVLKSIMVCKKSDEH
ncbi:MAG: glycosyltransferase [Thermoproteota archaeon]